MKKTISTLILACSTLVGFSQNLIQNGDIIATTSVASNYRIVTAKADSCQIDLAAFGSNSNIGAMYDNKSAGVSTTAKRMFIINEQVDGIISIGIGGYSPSKESIRINSNGQIMIEANCATHPQTPSAYMTIAPSAGAGKGPLKILPAPLLITPEPYLFEVDPNGDLYFTNGAGTRTKIN